MNYLFIQNIRWVSVFASDRKFNISLFFVHGVVGIACLLSFLFWSKTTLDLATNSEIGNLEEECELKLVEGRPTSALDQATSKKLISQLLCVGKNKFVIFVMHDLKLAFRCEQSIYLQ